MEIVNPKTRNLKSCEMNTTNKPYRLVVIAPCLLVISYLAKLAAVANINFPPFNNGHVFGGIWIVPGLSLVAYHGALAFLLRRARLDAAVLVTCSFAGAVVFPPVAVVSFYYAKRKLPSPKW